MSGHCWEMAAIGGGRVSCSYSFPEIGVRCWAVCSPRYIRRPSLIAESGRNVSTEKLKRCFKLICSVTETQRGRENPFVITTPLYYANAPPHMGSAYTTIAADAYARFQRLDGRKVLLITGTDEHGEKIASAASEKGLNPKAHCDDIVSDYQTLWEDLYISYDKFIRTTESSHEAIVKEFYRRVFDKGDIYHANYEGLYCVNCEEYKEKNELLEDKYCPIHRRLCDLRHEENYFFALSKYQKALEDLLATNPDFVQPQPRLNEAINRAKQIGKFVYNHGIILSLVRKYTEGKDLVRPATTRFATHFLTLKSLESKCLQLMQAFASESWLHREDFLQHRTSSDGRETSELVYNNAFWEKVSKSVKVQSWVKKGLKDFSISRASVQWGIPVPDDTKQTIYVWFDALLGYISALLEDKSEPDLDHAVQRGWPAAVHLIGKDILRFHAVYWPAMLMSAGLELPKVVFGHGFLTKDGLKMGKSLGNVLDPKALVDRFGSDAVRYYFLREVEFGNDGDYSEERFINIVNAHLANNIGNLLNRTLGLLKRYCKSTIRFDSEIAAKNSSLKKHVMDMVQKVRQHYSTLSFSSACATILDIANAGNAYLDERAPWAQFKKGGTNAVEAEMDLIIILEMMRIIALALSPVTPRLCHQICLQLGYNEDYFDSISWDHTEWGMLKAGQLMAEPKPIFQRFEDTKATGVHNLTAKQVVGKN